MASQQPHAAQARRSFFSHEDDDENATEEQRVRRARRHRIFAAIKISAFVLVWMFFTILMIVRLPYEVPTNIVPLDPKVPQNLEFIEKPQGVHIEVKISGKVDEQATITPSKAGKNQSYVLVMAININLETNATTWTSDEWKVYLDESEVTKMGKVKNSFDVGGHVDKRSMSRSLSDLPLRLQCLNMGDIPVALYIALDANPMDVKTGVICGFVLLCFLYILIIFDITDRTFAALLTASLGIGVLCMMHYRPDLDTIISWIDMETLMLLFGMMIMVAVLAETGVFDYLSVYAYHLSKGQSWVLIFLLCMLTVVLSAFLDNVTIIMLMVPVIIRLCECMGLRTTVVLISVAIFSNIGGALTPVGDPPNVIIATNPYVVAEGVNFLTFLLHMLPGVVFSIVGAWIYLFLVLRNKLYRGSEEQMRDSIKNLTKHAAKLNEPTPSDEQVRREIMNRIEELKERYRRKQDVKSFGLQPTTNFIQTLAEMESKYKLRNKPLLIKCIIALAFAILLFSLHSLPQLKGVTLAWAAVLAAVLLLVLANKKEMESVLEHVEWSTLLFFAGLFVLVEAVSELGLIEWVADCTISIIRNVEEQHRVVAAIMLVMWISAVFSAFVDNIPIVTMMLKLAVKLTNNDSLKLPLLPLIWAISYGVCFGGNGTLIAASSNVVAAGIANQHGYKITFMEFFKYGFPIMILTDIIATIYLLIAHGLFQWH